MVAFIKLAIVHFGFMYSGGGERTAIYEYLLLKKRGYDVTCFAPAFRPDVCYPELIREIDLKTLLPRVRMKLPLRDFLSMTLSSFLPLFFARRFSDFDAILCHGQPAIWIGYCIARTLKKKCICYLHQPARFLYPRPVDRMVGWKTKRDFALLDDLVKITRPFVRACDSISVSHAQRVLVNSRWISSQVKDIYGVDPVVCPPGVDIRKFIPIPNKSNMKVNGLDIKKPFILSTNRHYPQKRLDYLLNTMPSILKECDVSLVITGHFTRYTRRLMKMAKDLNIKDEVIFTNTVNETDLVRLYQNADVYAYTSPCEDFGLGPIEAMACGTPAVVWDYAGPTETVVDGSTGFRARPYSIDDFADKTLHLLNDEDLNRKMGRNAVDFVRKNYSWNRHMEILESVLLGLA